MRPVSAGWDSTIRGAHKMVVRATVCDTFQTGTTPAGTRATVFAGSVTLDGTLDIRSALDITVDGSNLWPTRVDSLYAPYGNELYVERGVQYSDALVEYVGLGYFGIRSPAQDAPPDGPIRLAAKDRMAGIVNGRLVEPVQFLAGATLGDVVSQLVTDIYPAATIEWDDSTDTATLERSVITDQNRYGFINDLITSRGKIWYWDHRGVLVIKDLPSPDDPVYQLTSGRGGTLVSMSRTLSRDGVYNGVVATGEAGDTDNPVRGVAIDSNPASPTYWGGRFGKEPLFYSSPLLSTGDQAEQAASTILRRQLGLPYTVRFGAVANPALEPYDAVAVTYSDRAGTETHVLQSLTIPLTADAAMMATSKEQTVVLIGTSA